jgi:AbrB family looped-hinge helix DNA binding protein
METTRLSSKGQLIVPKSVRDARHWDAGTEFAVEEVAEGILLRPVKQFPVTQFDDVYGMLKYKGKPKTLRQMDNAIKKVIKERHARGRY